MDQNCLLSIVVVLVGSQLIRQQVRISGMVASLSRLQGLALLEEPRGDVGRVPHGALEQLLTSKSQILHSGIWNMANPHHYHASQSTSEDESQTNALKTTDEIIRHGIIHTSHTICRG